MYTQASGCFMWPFSLKVQAIKVYRLARPMFHQACCPWYFPSHCCAKLWHISHCQTLTLAKVSHEQKLASKFIVTEIKFNVFLNSQVTDSSGGNKPVSGFSHTCVENGKHLQTYNCVAFFTHVCLFPYICVKIQTCVENST